MLKRKLCENDSGHSIIFTLVSTFSLMVLNWTVGRPWSVALLLEQVLLLHASGAHMTYPTSHMGLDLIYQSMHPMHGRFFLAFVMLHKFLSLFENALENIFKFWLVRKTTVKRKSISQQINFKVQK